MPDVEYQRLTRPRSRGFFAIVAMTRCSLWLGADHLLMVDFNGYTETYKRFYYRDIQAFIVQRSAAFTITYVVLAIPFTILTVSGLMASNAGLRIFLFSLAGLLALIGIIHILRGQTCRCFLRTAVQVEQLPPLNRLRRAEKIIARLRPLIATAQGGELTRDTISERMSELAQTPAATSTSPGLASPENPEAPLSVEP
jgi:hypothetical protein